MPTTCRRPQLAGAVLLATLALGSAPAAAQASLPGTALVAAGAGAAFEALPPGEPAPTLAGGHALAALSLDLARNARLSIPAGWASAAGKDMAPIAPAPRGTGLGLDHRIAGAPPHAASCLWQWLRCSAFSRIEGRLAAYDGLLDGRSFETDPEVKRRNFVGHLITGFRLDFPHTRANGHGPWFLQFRIMRRTPQFRSSIPVPARTVAALTVGTEF